MRSLLVGFVLMSCSTEFDSVAEWTCTAKQNRPTFEFQTEVLSSHKLISIKAYPLVEVVAIGGEDLEYDIDSDLWMYKGKVPLDNVLDLGGVLGGFTEPELCDAVDEVLFRYTLKSGQLKELIVNRRGKPRPEKKAQKN